MNLKKTTLASIPGLLILAIILASTTTGFALENKYDLFDLIEAGLDKTIPYQTDLLQNRNVHSSLISSYFDFLPSASVRTSHELAPGDSRSAGFYLSKSISLNEPTYFNWRRASIDWENAKLEIDNLRKATVLEIFTRYMNVLESRKRLEIQRNNLELQENIYAQVELLYQQQQRAIIDLRQSEIALINAQISLENAEILYRQARENLFLYLDMEDLGYDLREPEIEITEEEYEYRKPLELYVAENNLKRSSVSLWQSRLDFLPSLTLSYNYQHSYPGRHVTDDIFDFRQYEDSYTIALTASYSLFNLLEHREAHSRNRRNLRIQEMQYDYLSNSKERQFEQMNRSWENQQRVYDLAERRYELAQENMEMARERYNLGISSLLELDQATSDFLEAELDLTSRYYQLLIKQEEINLFLSRRILDRW